jgi:hypothetical protein
MFGHRFLLGSLGIVVEIKTPKVSHPTKRNERILTDFFSLARNFFDFIN